MNDVQYLIDRQLGISGRFGYDNVVKRLVVREAEAYHGLGSPGADDPPIFACRFAEAPGLEHILALANEDGRVAIQDISKPDADGSLEGFQCHNNAVFDLAWRPGHMNFVTVSGDHTACLWDVAEGAPRRVLSFSHHTRSVKTAVFRPHEPSVFATGARDGNILVWDIRAAAQPAVVVKPDNALLACHSSFTPKTPGSHGKRARVEAPRPVSITGLVFQDDRTLLSCGECDGNIKVWDLRKNYSVYTREPLPKRAIPYCGSSTRNGYTNLIVDAARVRLYASCMDNVIYCFNIATYSPLPERRYSGHENATFYIKTSLSPDCRYLVSGSSDTHAYIWNVRASRPVVRLAGHRAEVTCAAWARACTPTLVTCSDDARHMVWRVGLEEDNDDTEYRGRAEVLPKAEPTAGPHWGGADKTPASLKRKTTTPAEHANKRPRTERKTKRCLTDLLNASQEESTSKRARLEEPERPLIPTGSKRPHSGDPLSPIKRTRFQDVDSENASESSSDDAYRTPKKSYRDREILSPRSPNTLSPEVSPNTRVRQFAAALPDFVRDGDAPHLRLMSPGKRKTDAPDWLTLLSRAKRPKTAELPTLPPSSPSPAPTPPPAPARRGSTSERTPKSAAKTRTLLKYFTVANKEKL
ncbi:protein lethal(2)denticleless [Phthorimaea operculella]|nr:protein lethal(2)denticleless [Phthorimaea operculella]